MGPTGCISLYHYVLRVALFPCVSSIFCMGDLFALRALSLPPCTNIPCVSLLQPPPLLCTYIPYIHCVVSIPCMGHFFALRVLFPAPCTYIPCTSLHGCLQLPCIYIPCVGDLFAFTMLFPPPYTYIPYISLCRSLHGSQHGSPPLP